MLQSRGYCAIELCNKYLKLCLEQLRIKAFNLDITIMYSVQFANEYASLLVVLILLTAAFLYKTVTHPLAAIPGPFLAKFTNARFLYHAWRGDLHLDHLRCHETYGTTN